MSHLNQPDRPCPLQDMRDVAKYQCLQPSGEGYEHTRPYYQEASTSNSRAILPSASYDAQFLQRDGYPQDSRVNLQGSYTDGQQLPPGYGRGERDSGDGFRRILSTQSVPRQRAAIACRYCRRRKIKCSESGESAAQRRCTNCQRLQQECIFVPVSSKPQAYVLAHLAYPPMQNMGIDSNGGVHLLLPNVQQLYGAHGQPLRQFPPTTADSPSDTPVPLTELCGSFKVERIEGSHKRRCKQPHPSILPPPIPGQLHHCQGSARRPAAEDNLHLPP
ncbi:hypothetical protein B0O99DRAFT_694746 [Bisporella sp. PMI_857]|nr:hypothetical protein B0O99DRAFT_694746 [Bisporella sp. PMI_857]